MEYYEDLPTGIVIIALRRGDLLFESIERVAREADIHSGVLMSGIGSLTRAHIHTVRSTDYPPREEYFQLQGALEIVQFGGIIASHQPHLHISLWDERRNYFGGHVHEGCEVLTLSEISIHRLKDLRLARRALDSSGVGLLTRA